jgi:hypothetical protein
LIHLGYSCRLPPNYKTTLAAMKSPDILPYSISALNVPARCFLPTKNPSRTSSSSLTTFPTTLARRNTTGGQTTYSSSNPTPSSPTQKPHLIMALPQTVLASSLQRQKDRLGRTLGGKHRFMDGWSGSLRGATAVFNFLFSNPTSLPHLEQRSTSRTFSQHNDFLFNSA